LLRNLTADKQKPAKLIKCPTCKKPVVWSEANPWRPFCSERCKLIDLGDWIEERHRIPDSTEPPDSESSD
jgi:endogenous inhibitor of DNA gyrase (YacG/DUF329 family)